MTKDEVTSILEEYRTEKLKLKEFTSMILKALKMIGGTVAQYYMFKLLINSILMDKKFTDQLAGQISKRLDAHNRKTAQVLMNPTVPIAVKGYAPVQQLSKIRSPSSRYRA